VELIRRIAKKKIMRIIKFYAHEGKCLDCSGVVKMGRNQDTMKLLFKNCWCILCGSQFQADLEGLAPEEFEKLQWEQKETIEKYYNKKDP
jgi:hypothetical protein